MLETDLTVWHCQSSWVCSQVLGATSWGRVASWDTEVAVWAAGRDQKQILSLLFDMKATSGSKTLGLRVSQVLVGMQALPPAVIIFLGVGSGGNPSTLVPFP